MLRDGDFAKGFVERFRWQLGIQLPQRGAQPFRQKRLAKTGTFRGGFAGGDLLAVQQTNNPVHRTSSRWRLRRWIR